VGVAVSVSGRDDLAAEEAVAEITARVDVMRQNGDLKGQRAIQTLSG
jgi:hypothetical protein